MNRYLGRAAVCLVASVTAACTVQQPRPGGLVTPASAHCHARGGRVVLGYTAEGREGLCFLPDGALVDERQLYRGEHPCGTDR